VSYCRWSCDDFKSDFYVYAHVDGSWTIHLAGNRVVGDVPRVPFPTDLHDPAQVAAYAKASKARSRFLDKAQRVAIGLPHDSETFKLDSPGECAAKCEELAALGYRLPAWVVDDLRAEQVEIDAEDAVDGSHDGLATGSLGAGPSAALGEPNPSISSTLPKES
jgi:hypothetical protein